MLDKVQEYYGKVLQGSEDLKTDACCTTDDVPPHVQAALARVHPDVSRKYYGCGLVAPAHLAGARVLDLGCGTGRDCYVLSQLVGAEGTVVGVDMTDEQLDIAVRTRDHHAAEFGFANVEFRNGYIEKLDELGFDAGSFDVIVSNCVINLSPDKEAVLQHAWRLLKDGGEMYFSDVYADRRVPAALAGDPVLYGECLAGALYWNDFQNLAKRAGFTDPRLVEDRPLTIGNPDIAARIGHIQFFSATYRLFKLPQLENHCEDYGQAVIYKGTVDHHPHVFSLDKHHVIETGKTFPVCGNTWRMLHDTRFADHFDFIGNWDTHYGIFDGCGTAIPFGANPSIDAASGSCC